MRGTSKLCTTKSREFVIRLMHDGSQEKFRELPPVNEILSLDSVGPMIAEHGRDSVRAWARAAVADLRESISSGSNNGSPVREQLIESVVESLRRRAAGDESTSFGRVI